MKREDRINARDLTGGGSKYTVNPNPRSLIVISDMAAVFRKEGITFRTPEVERMLVDSYLDAYTWPKPFFFMVILKDPANPEECDHVITPKHSWMQPSITKDPKQLVLTTYLKDDPKSVTEITMEMMSRRTILVEYGKGLTRESRLKEEINSQFSGVHYTVKTCIYTGMFEELAPYISLKGRNKDDVTLHKLLELKLRRAVIRCA